jgi:hypothetical protein
MYNGFVPYRRAPLKYPRIYKFDTCGWQPTDQNLLSIGAEGCLGLVLRVGRISERDINVYCRWLSTASNVQSARLRYQLSAAW